MAQQEVKDVLDALKLRLAKIKGIKDVDLVQPKSLVNLPRIVLHYLDSPWILDQGRNQIDHTIMIEVIVAPQSDRKRSRVKALSFINDIKRELMTKSPGLILIPQPNQTTLGSTGSQGTRNVVYDDTPYFAAMVIVKYIEVTGETFL